MTSLAFIFGVVPLVWAVGAGAELRQTLGTTVFSGMIGVTAFGLIFTPVFYVLVPAASRLTRRDGATPQPSSGLDAGGGVAPPEAICDHHYGRRTKPQVIRWHYLVVCRRWRSLS